MFDTLSDRLSAVFTSLRGKGRLSDADIDATAREIRIALLEADVALPVDREFINSDKERARGRVVPSGSHARHARRATDAARRLGRGRSWGFRSVTVVDRARARAGLVLDARPLP